MSVGLVEPYGKNWTLKYRPQVGDRDVTPVGNPTIYVFEDLPSEEDARDGTGALHTVNSWVFDASTNVATATIPAISDPQDGQDTDLYYLGINFAVETGGQLQNEIRGFYLSRPDGITDNPLPTALEIDTEYDTTLSEYYGTGWEIIFDAFLKRAETDVKRELRAKGKDWSKIANVGDFKDAIAYRMLMSAYLDQRQEQGDRWDSLYEDYKERYKMTMRSIKIVEEIYPSTPPDPELQLKKRVTWLQR